MMVIRFCKQKNFISVNEFIETNSNFHHKNQSKYIYQLMKYVRYLSVFNFKNSKFVR